MPRYQRRPKLMPISLRKQIIAVQEQRDVLVFSYRDAQGDIEDREVVESIKCLDAAAATLKRIKNHGTNC